MYSANEKLATTVPSSPHVDEEAILNLQLDILYGQAMVAISATVVSASLLCIGLWVVYPRASLLLWLVAVLSIALFRILVVRRYQSNPARSKQLKTNLRLYAIGVALSGIAWGSAPMLLISFDSPFTMGMVILWICGITAGSVAAFSIVPAVFYIFASLALLPGALYLLIQSDVSATVLGTGMLLFYFFISFNSHRMYKSMYSALLTQLENRQLITKLELEKQRVAQLNEQLENKIAKRTTELQQINRQLELEIAERIEAETKLKQAATVFENTTEGAIILDRDQKIIAVNAAFEEITGYKETNILSKELDFLYSQGETNCALSLIWEDVEQDGKWQGEMWSQSCEKESYLQWLNISAVHADSSDIIGYVCLFADITPIRETQQRLEYIAHHDGLTKLPNRLLFYARLQHAMERARRDSNLVAVLFYDLDRFKNINDNLGHDAGDHVLQLVALRLDSIAREEDTVARLGGDEFIVLLEGVQQASDAAAVAKKIIRAMEQPFLVNGSQVYMTASIGIALYPRDGDKETLLLKRADHAMYMAKQRGRNNFQFYADEVNSASAMEATHADLLHSALNAGEFEVYYQPVVSLATEKIVGAEALVRWKQNKGNVRLPKDFIAMAEETGFIVELDRWVLNAACTQARLWNEIGLNDFSIIVNMSALHLEQEDTPKFVKQALKSNGLKPNRLEIDIAEKIVMQSSSRRLHIMRQLKKIGVNIAIDNFGTGCCSLVQLQLLPIDRLKIDRSYINKIDTDPLDIALAKSAISIANHLNLVVVAEGVETHSQLETLQKNRCDEVQGFLYGVPTPAEEFLEKIRSNRDGPQS